MKRRSAYLGTSAGTITTPRPLSMLERLKAAQVANTQAGGAAKPPE